MRVRFPLEDMAGKKKVGCLRGWQVDTRLVYFYFYAFCKTEKPKTLLLQGLT